MEFIIQIEINAQIPTYLKRFNIVSSIKLHVFLICKSIQHYNLNSALEQKLLKKVSSIQLKLIVGA